MAKSSLLSILFLVIMATMAFHASFSGAATCNQSCKSNDGCDGELACNDGKCGDDPEVGTNICGGGDGSNGGGDGSNGDAAPPPPSGEAGGGGGGTCRSSGKLSCGDNSFPQFTCSPPVTSSTRATLSVNSFSKGGDGGDPSECDGKFHDDDSPVVALSTGWYDGGSRCGKKIRITAKNGKSVEATVVDECDSVNGCDDAHAGQPPCKNNIVDGSPAVWDALGLDQDVGLVDVTWAEA